MSYFEESGTERENGDDEEDDDDDDRMKRYRIRIL